MPQKRLSIIAAFLFFALPWSGSQSIAHAEDLNQTEPLIVTGTVIPRRLGNSPLRASVITHEEIEARKIRTVKEALEQVPGVHIDQPGTSGGVASVYLRGADPNFTLVLIDGIRVNDPTNTRGGAFDFSTLSIENVERIEVVKGPQSLAYGSDALAGVIQIITRRGKTKGGTLDTEAAYGSDDWVYALAQSEAAMGEHGISMGASYLDSGNPDDETSAQGRSVNARTDLHLSDSTDATLTVRYNDSDNRAFPEDSGGKDFAVIRETDDKDRSEFLTGFEIRTRPEEDRSHNLFVSYSNIQDESHSAGVSPGLRDPFGIPPNTFDNSFYRVEVLQRNDFQFNENFSLSAGGSYQFEQGESDSVLVLGEDMTLPGTFELERSLGGVFAETQYTCPFGVTIQAGGRVEFPEDFSNEFIPRVAASYTVPEIETLIQSTWGKGFKLPSFFALGNAIVGNTELAPEKSTGFDFTLEQPLLENTLTAAATYFIVDYKDPIDLVEGPPPSLINRDEINTDGVEFTIDYKPAPTLSFSPFTTYTEFDIADSDERLRNRPHWRSGAVVRWDATPEVILSTSVLYVGEVLDSSIPTGDMQLSDYTVFDVAGEWKAFEQGSVYLAIKNLFDTDYETILGNPAPGVSPQVGVKMSF